MKEGWRKNEEWWRMNDEGWWFQAVEGFCRQTDRQTNERTDICDCRVAFATEKWKRGALSPSRQALSSLESDKKKL